MNLLVDILPTHAKVAGKDIPLKTDFRFALYTLLSFEDMSLTSFERMSVMLNNALDGDIPDGGVEEARNVCIWFLNGGSDADNGENPGRRLYSFSQDAGMIYAAFNSTHRIDLQSVEHLHWWKFLALFMDLGQDTTFCNIVSLRKRYYAGICTKEEKSAIQGMGKSFFIEDTEILTAEEMELERSLDGFLHQEGRNV